MAKGWESKSVEDQIQNSEERESRKGRAQVTPAQVEQRRRRNLLILSRTRVEAELSAATDQRYRDQLSRALTDIEAQISALEEVPQV
ncbi:MAG TPA: hypothetical protein VI216_02580 [Candidatus Acidoferrales bacterium]